MEPTPAPPQPQPQPQHQYRRRWSDAQPGESSPLPSPLQQEESGAGGHQLRHRRKDSIPESDVVRVGGGAFGGTGVVRSMMWTPPARPFIPSFIQPTHVHLLTHTHPHTDGGVVPVFQQQHQRHARLPLHPRGGNRRARRPKNPARGVPAAPGRVRDVLRLRRAVWARVHLLRGGHGGPRGRGAAQGGDAAAGEAAPEPPLADRGRVSGVE